MAILWRLILTTSITTGLIGLILGCAIVVFLEPQLPPAEEIRDIDLQIPLRIYTRDEKLIGEFGEKRRTPIKFDDVPPLFIKAILAAEDDSFFEHPGIDIKGLARAAVQLATTGSIQSGGSTITMQVAKNYFLSFDQTFTRKFTEILLSFKLESELTKQEILELYVNKIYLGKRAYGIQAASHIYYGKPIAQLSLAQQAMIAGLPKAPSRYNPIANASRATTRRDWILARMLKLGYIDTGQYDIAVSQPVSAKFHGPVVEVDAPYVSEMIRRQMINRYGIKAYTQGYKVYTTIDSRLQQQAHTAVVNGLNAYDGRHGYRGPEQQLEVSYTPKDYDNWQAQLRHIHTVENKTPAVVSSVSETSAEILFEDGHTATLNWDSLSTVRRHISENRLAPAATSADNILAVGDLIRVSQNTDSQWELDQIPNIQGAFVALDSNNGALLALTGGYHFKLSKFNRATQAKRQPGSNFKPFFYAYALEQGFTPASLINDAPIVFNDKGLENLWRPDNSSGKFYGPTPLRRALYLSRNLVSIRLMQALGVSGVRNYVTRFGFDSKSLPRNLSLALGTQTASPLQIASAYTILSNGGYKVKPYWLGKIIGPDNEEIYLATPALACTDCDKVTEEDLSVTDFDELSATGFDELVAPDEQIPQAERVVDARTIYLVDSILQDVVNRGTATKAKVLKRSDLAGKTGTTNGPTDAWFSGYNGKIAATAWVGFDEYQELGNREFGGSAALPIWIEFMEEALKGIPDVPRKQPQGIVSALIEPSTGLRAKAGSANVNFEFFREDNLPPFSEQTQSRNNDNNTAISESGIF